MNWWYTNIVSSGVRGYLNYTFFHFRTLRRITSYVWNREKKNWPVEGVCVDLAKSVKKAVKVPVLCTGGFQDGRLIRKVISEGYVDAVSREMLGGEALQIGGILTNRGDMCGAVQQYRTAALNNMCKGLNPNADTTTAVCSNRASIAWGRESSP